MVGELVPHLGFLKEEHRRVLHRAGDEIICGFIPGPVWAMGIGSAAVVHILAERGAISKKLLPQENWDHRDPGMRISQCIGYGPQWGAPQRTPLEYATFDREPFLPLRQRGRP